MVLPVLNWEHQHFVFLVSILYPMLCNCGASHLYFFFQRKFPHYSLSYLLACLNIFFCLPKWDSLKLNVPSKQLSEPSVNSQVENRQKQIAQNEIIIAQACQIELHISYMVLVIDLKLTIEFYFSCLIFYTIHIVNSEQAQEFDLSNLESLLHIFI